MIDRSAPVSPQQASKRHQLDVGAVVIGRNEGGRLSTCIKALHDCHTVVYVDSGSNDGSPALAANLGANVVELNMESPFTAARARNAGFERLCQLTDGGEYVQFVDGDCEVLPGWISGAVNFLESHPEISVVCGRRFERNPTISIYNAMCHREWNTPVGETHACGGDALMRAAALRTVGGFANEQVAHEEPELCGRLRKAGFRIWRLDLPMTLHDAAIFRLRQFYNRSRRAGFGMTQCLVRSGCNIDPNARDIVRRSISWVIILPIIILSSTLVWKPAAVAFLIYPTQILRHAVKDQQGAGGDLRNRMHVAALSMIGKFAEAHGSIEFVLRKVMHQKMTGIFYK